MTADLAGFLLDRIAEDEEAAREATPGRWSWSGGTWNYLLADEGAGTSAAVVESDAPLYVSVSDEEYIGRWQPARVLAECEAKRRIVEQQTMFRPDMLGYRERQTLCLLALPYADHQAYREEWRP